MLLLLLLLIITLVCASPDDCHCYPGWSGPACTTGTIECENGCVAEVPYLMVIPKGCWLKTNTTLKLDDFLIKDATKDMKDLKDPGFFMPRSPETFLEDAHERYGIQGDDMIWKVQYVFDDSAPLSMEGDRFRPSTARREWVLEKAV